MEFRVGFKTDIGRKRVQNQDNGVARPELGLFVVSDGMGGHKGGETASAIAVESIQHSIQTQEQEKTWEPQKAISKAIELANRAIYQRALREPELQGMGTTTTAMLFKKNHLAIGHVGDSRCYFFRANAFWQLTRDHSLVQEKLRAGLITREQLKTDKMKNVITRSVGFEESVQVDVYQMQVQKGDCFLLCSDGLSGPLQDLEILKIIDQKLFENQNVEEAVNELILSANNKGGDDNITSILVQIMEV